MYFKYLLIIFLVSGLLAILNEKKYLVTMLTLYAVGVTLLGFYMQKETVGDNVIKTVAHVSLDGRDDLELIARDPVNDIAYYKYVVPNLSEITIGTVVTLRGGYTATVVSTDLIGFVIKPDVPVVAGMSGTAVLSSDGEQIGYISQKLADDTVVCIWS